MTTPPSPPDETASGPGSLRPGDVPTVRPDPPKETGSSWIDESRFPPGHLLAGRYRIVGRLGRGGMGEVYRADDLKLGQSVALKFLPEAMATDTAWLRRLHDEVRIARQLAHPNVCRVYDIGEVDGEHFITMEYVDGEDLSGLLRRIGRLPKDKAVQIARQLCAGIAAAHERGVLHRDLKPANVMLDGRGHVRITDFGIAALADRPDDNEVRVGTPAYMAPEQLAGRGVTRRSDIYSLGLILYEVFTGREAFGAESFAQLQRMRESGPPTTPSSYVDDIDPSVDRVIMRCLENEPQDRPGSAIAVAAALPGGDPLAQALAAGETPSPEMIAEAGQKGGLRPAVAVTCLMAVVAITVAWSVLSGRRSVLQRSPDPKPPRVLADRAREIVTDLGYAERPVSSAWWYWCDTDYLRYVSETDQSPSRWDGLATGRPPAVLFSYRSAPEPMVPFRVRRVLWDDPPLVMPGMVRVILDAQGRLFRFDAVAPAVMDDTPAPAPDWSPLFAAADLDPAALTPATPSWTPVVYCDSRAAWTGVLPGTNVELRVEAGAVMGTPVSFDVISPWRKPRGTDTMDVRDRVGSTLFAALLVLIPVAAGIIVWRHLRSGRGDRKGAARLALYVFAVKFGAWLFTADHAMSWGQWDLVARAFANACALAVLCWIFYLALEPYARRHWPRAMVSWTRVLAGRFRDPLVGRDVLAGCLSGVVIPVSFAAAGAALPLIGAAPAVNPTETYTTLLGARYVIGEVLEAQLGIGVFLGAFVLLLLARMALRRPWLANGAFALVTFALFSGFDTTEPGWPVWWVQSAALAALVLVTMIRFGLLSLVVMAFVASLLFEFPSTFDLSRWYAGAGLIGPALVLALAAYGFWISMAGRPLFRDQFSDAPQARVVHNAQR